MNLIHTIKFDGALINISLTDITTIEFIDKYFKVLKVYNKDEIILELKSNDEKLKKIYESLLTDWNKFKHWSNKFNELKKMINKYESFLETFNKVNTIGNFNERKN